MVPRPARFDDPKWFAGQRPSTPREGTADGRGPVTLARGRAPPARWSPAKAGLDDSVLVVARTPPHARPAQSPPPRDELLLLLDPPHLANAVGQPLRVRVEEALELVALLEGDRRLELVHRALELGLRDRGSRSFAQLRQHRLRRPLRREDTGPDVELDLGVAELLEGRHVRQCRDPLVAPAGQRAQLARLDVRDDDG